MNSIKKVADKIATPHHDGHVDSHHTTGATNFTDKRVDFTNDVSMSQTTTTTGLTTGIATGVTAGKIVESHQVGTVDVVETTQTVKKVPVVETTRVIETGVAGMSVHEHDHLHKHEHADAHHHKVASAVIVDLPTTSDHKTIIADTVVEEKIRQDLLVQVQPVIHKEIEVEEVHHVVKHINEAAAASVAGSVTLAPVVQEHVHTHVIEEIHPVIHREIVQQVVERREEHITEHIVVPAKHVHEVVTEFAPVHVHDAHCHHEISTERLNAVILPGTTGLGASNVATTVTTREVLADRAGPAHVIGQHSEVMAGHATATTTTTTATTGVVGRGVVVEEVVLRPGEEIRVGHAHGGHGTEKIVATDKHGHTDIHGNKVVIKPGDELLLQKNNLTGETVVVEQRHGGHIVAGEHTTGHVEAGGSAHHHHLHLPHFLGGHKKDEVVVEKHAL